MDHDELIFRSFQGRLSSREEMSLGKWREADPEHEQRYREFAAVWRATEHYEGDVETEVPEVDTITERIAVRHPKSRAWWRRLWPVAGVVAAFVSGTLLANVSETTPSPEGQGGEIVTGAGETTTLRFPDGTVIRLAPESRLALPAMSDGRSVILDGQAFFAVSADPENPFLVQTPSGEARVLGTRFELDARRDQLRLLVVEGLVTLVTGRTEVDVRAREMAHLRDGEAPSTVEVEDVWPLLGWIGDFLAFKSTPLRQVARELERRFDVTLVFDDPTLAEETVTVWFRDEPIDEVVSILCRLMESQCTMDNSLVRMRRTP